MNQVIIRDVEIKDLPEIKEIISTTWNLRRLVENESTLQAVLGLYRNKILHGSTFGRVAVSNDKVVGLIFGSIVGESPKYRLLQEDSVEHTLALLKATENERVTITEFMSKIFHTYGQLINNQIDSYDGYVEFFVVSEEARGLKLGKKLWNELATYFKENNAQSIFLYTDTSCNFGFYDYNGFSRKGEQEVTFDFANHQEKLNVFLYDYQFNK